MYRNVESLLFVTAVRDVSETNNFDTGLVGGVRGMRDRWRRCVAGVERKQRGYAVYASTRNPARHELRDGVERRPIGGVVRSLARGVATSRIPSHQQAFVAPIRYCATVGLARRVGRRSLD